MEGRYLLTRDVLFEPWSLGDAIVAAAAAREDTDRFALVCDERWIDLIRSGSLPHSRMALVGLYIPYTMRQAEKKYSKSRDLRISSNSLQVGSILNIRGDIRDYLAARKLFPQATIRQTGWYSFLARRSRIFDVPAKLGLFSIRNRYQAWAQLTGIPFRAIQERYAVKVAAPNRNVVIHVGAQWLSKRYPHVGKLVEELRKLNIETNVVRGPGDPLMPGLDCDCPEISGLNLAKSLKNSGVVIANDSGPMHLAAYLGCRTICVGGISNLDEWLPPSVCAIVSPDMPKGYRPMASYMSDTSHSNWPAPEVIVEQVVSILNTVPRR